MARFSLVERAEKFISKMPAAIAGQHGHAATYHVACVLVQGFGLTPSQAMPLLEGYNARCEPPWSAKELEHKLDGANKAAGLRRKGGVVLPRGCLARGLEFKPSKAYYERHHIAEVEKPRFENEALRRFAGEFAGKVDLLWLADRSAEDPCTITSAGFLSLLYRPHHKDLFSHSGSVYRQEKVLIFENEFSQGEFIWPDDKDRLPTVGLNGIWFLAQPVDGNYYPNPRSINKKTGEPQMSRRSEESVMAWRYFVIESDKAKARPWLGAIVQLPLRIAAIYTSGSRSVHALVQIDARTKSEWDVEKDAMKRSLVTLGACPGSMSAVRLTRLPGCWREGKTVEEKTPGKKRYRYIRFPKPGLQKLLYINPSPPMRPIAELAPQRNVLEPWLRWASLGIADSDETNGVALTHALHYYAPVSDECRQALHRLSRAQTKKQ
jgi:hypothetical protein